MIQIKYVKKFLTRNSRNLLTETTISIEESNFEMRIGSASLFFMENITNLKRNIKLSNY